MIDGLLISELKAFADDRGVIRELFRASAMPPQRPWKQVNLTETVQGAVRGMHAEDMTKLVGVATGEAFGAWVDLRPDSRTYGEVVTVPLVVGTSVLVPAGVGNGFQATAPGVTQYVYCFDEEWRPDMPGVACSPLDPELAIPWPLPISALSEKDRSAPTLAELRATR
jgi:dTDP-4-dehydrorhamnose 3,5-epimerase